MSLFDHEMIQINNKSSIRIVQSICFCLWMSDTRYSRWLPRTVRPMFSFLGVSGKTWWVYPQASRLECLQKHWLWLHTYAPYQLNTHLPGAGVWWPGKKPINSPVSIQSIKQLSAVPKIVTGCHFIITENWVSI